MASTQGLQILFVCTANICRSPMAEALLTTHIAGADTDLEIQISSASIDSEVRVLHPLVIKVLGERGLTLDPKNSQPLSSELVEQSDLILTMTGAHAIAVAGRYRQARLKVLMVDHFVQIARQRGDGETVDQWLAGVTAHPRSYPQQRGAHDVPDPIGHNEAVFRKVADQLDALVRQIAVVLSHAGGG